MNEPLKPNPGSKEAIAQGCKCPVLDNSHGRGYMGIAGIFVYSGECKLHITKDEKEKDSH